MNKYTLSSRLSRIQEELPKLSSTITAMKITDTELYSKNYEELSLDAAIRAERVACSLRNLIFAANLVERPVLMDLTAEEHGITICHSHDRVEITLPGLMPKRIKRVNTTFLTEPLYHCLEKYSKEHTLPHFKECVVCFSHVFDRSLPSRRVRDYDNLECKQILDTAASFLMTDDSGLYCDAYHTTEFGDCDCTILTIMETSAFPGWLKELKNKGFTISDF